MATLAFMSIPGLVIGLFVLGVVDRLGLWANGRFRLPWRRDESGRGIAAGAFEGFEVFYAGSKHNELKERRSSLVRRDEESDGAPPTSRVDLDEGVARIRLP